MASVAGAAARGSAHAGRRCSAPAMAVRQFARPVLHPAGHHGRSRAQNSDGAPPGFAEVPATWAAPSRRRTELRLSIGNGAAPRCAGAPRPRGRRARSASRRPAESRRSPPSWRRGSPDAGVRRSLSRHPFRLGRGGVAFSSIRRPWWESPADARAPTMEGIARVSGWPAVFPSRRRADHPRMGESSTPSRTDAGADVPPAAGWLGRPAGGISGPVTRSLRPRVVHNTIQPTCS